LALLCFSSGSVDAVPEKEKEHLEKHLQNARFVAALNGKVLQVISTRPKDRAPTPEEFARLGKLLSELGRRTREVGVRLVYHNHMNAFGESPEEVARVLELTDPQYVSLLLDVAHYLQGGGDPVAAVSRHKDRLAILHLKDVRTLPPAEVRPGRPPYQWVELGKGRVDLPGVIAALKKISFDGPAIIELDAVTASCQTPADCAAANKKYAVETLGLSL
jgi:inosose dehydratase